MLKDESALLILVPEAEPLVGHFRERFDPSAAVGVPAHITLLYPFVAPEQVDGRVLNSLAACFAQSETIDYALTEVQRFPAETLYLKPDPVEPFRTLTMAIWKRFPETPPYGGIWPDIVPHLSIGRFNDEAQLDRNFRKLTLEFAGKLPIRACARSVALMGTTSGRWTARRTFDLMTRQSSRIESDASVRRP